MSLYFNIFRCDFYHKILVLVNYAVPATLLISIQDFDKLVHDYFFRVATQIYCISRNFRRVFIFANFAS